MSTGSKIEWTEDTWNPIAGCTPVSPGCLNCYAATMSARLSSMGQMKYRGLTVLNNRRQVFNGKISFDEVALTMPLSRSKPRMYFVNSMSDLFHEEVPFEFVDKVFAIMALCPQHTFQVLTKRPDRMAKYLSDFPKVRTRYLTASDAWDRTRSKAVEQWPLPNVWLGASVENQEWAQKRIPHLARCPAQVRFLSYEPALGPINFLKISADPPNSGFAISDGLTVDGDPYIHWVIAGGESGHFARPCQVEWIASVVAECKSAGVPCFVKQLGKVPMVQSFALADGWAEHVRAYDRPGGLWVSLTDQKGGDINEWPEPLRVRQMPEVRR